MTKTDHTSEQGAKLNDAIVEISEILKKLHFGSIQLTIHNGKLVQLDVTEKRRFTA